MKDRIYLYYKTHLLGELSFDGNKYIYNSLNDSSVKDKFVGLLNYNLYDSKNLESEELFGFFKIYFIDKILNLPELLKRLNKTKTDNYFEILFEFAKLNQDDIGFNLKINQI